MPRILVVDDHALIRSRIRQVLEKEKGWEVCGEAANGREGVQMAAQCKPDIVLTDLSMPESNGIEATREILRQAPETKIIILTMHDPADYLFDATDSGAHACVLKSRPQDLVAAIRALCQPVIHARSA